MDSWGNCGQIEGYEGYRGLAGSMQGIRGAVNSVTGALGGILNSIVPRVPEQGPVSCSLIGQSLPTLCIFRKLETTCQDSL
jgi:hypothetical protein